MDVTCPARPQCGTQHGYWLHWYHAEIPGRVCMDAHNAVKRAYRARVLARAAAIAGRPVTHREAAQIVRAASHA